MTANKYALGMGDTDFLNDGVYETLDEAHAEALRLKDLAHDNGDYHSSYVIGEVAATSLVAAGATKTIIDSVIDFIGEEVDELEDLNGVMDNFILINDEGKEKLEAVLKDILLNHTKYPRDEVVININTYHSNAGAQTIKCPYCRAEKQIAPCPAQVSGFSRYTSVECKDCNAIFHSVYNKEDNSLVAQSIRL